MSITSYAYARPSELTADGLDLQTSGGRAANPRFFDGFMTTPQPVAAGLLAVADVARTRYFQPTRPGSLDPVVTGSGGMLRFESFSGCCGVYARLDVLPAGLDGHTPDHGTTNVDVNDPLRLSLARINGLDPLRLAVGPDDLTVSTMEGTLVERRVPLPTRWLRGFAEVAVITAGMQPRASIPATEAADFLRRLPADRSVLWAVPSGRSLRLTSRPTPGAVCLTGTRRLTTLRSLLRHATTLTIYGPDAGPASPALASAWMLETPTTRLLLTLSPEPHRGFSGEGAVLAHLAGPDVTDDADLVSAMLAWDPAIDVKQLAAGCGMSTARVSAALALLGTAGRVGFDVAAGAYFHRVMPFGTDAAARLNPRLAEARELVAAGAVRDAGDHVTVTSGSTVYGVRLTGDTPAGCTCQWWGKHRGSRGPCKHQLAVLITRGALAEVAE